MQTVGRREAETQNDVIAFFKDTLRYSYLGNWKDRPGNDNIDEDRSLAWLRKCGYPKKLAEKAIRQLQKLRPLAGGKNLYDANKDVYEALRYGVKVVPEAGEHQRTVWFIDWEHPEKNEFALAEEVTVKGKNVKRPDIVLYVNGIALGVIELKRSTVAVSEGIRQNLDNQKAEFIEDFFTTVQLVMAGSDTEGLRYGVIGTREKYYLIWTDTDPLYREVGNPLLRDLGRLCSPRRFLELIHDFMAYDAGTKKTSRHNQYFGVRAAQDRIRMREGGIIWHTQGSGKSLTMVWLARWIWEHVTDARVLIVTDRKELDEQIENVFMGVGEKIRRTRSGDDLVRELKDKKNWLLCSLIHKFGTGDELRKADLDAFIAEIAGALGREFKPAGNFFIFVDECHRTQSGELHDAMKRLLPDALFIGFTGTPLLAQDKVSSIQKFGGYIHTYKYDEAVRDGVVLDLRYEARDIDQSIASQDKIDQWFEAKTRGLTDYARAQIKQRWGTMQKVLSARDRLAKITADILMDMETKDRLASGRGNALLVCDSIYSACRFFQSFNETHLKGRCAIVTSYAPDPASIKGEETGEGLTEKLLQYDTYRRMLADFFRESEDKAQYRADEFERIAKKRFVEEPGQMKLLVVVDKLLTGFDAPSATYLYIDKQMRDHGLFQAICRVNRLDGDDKEYGYIVDYKDLFRSLEKAIKDYTGEAFNGYEREDIENLISDRLEKDRERLDVVRESLKALCEPVSLPRTELAYTHYFVAEESGNLDQIKLNAPKRVQLYKLVSAYLRAYADIANEMEGAGYSAAEAAAIRAEVEHYETVRMQVKVASGDYVDMKLYEPAMRHLLDTYIRAEESEKLSAFDDFSLIELIVERGEDAVDGLPPGLRGNKEAVAETIENNVRRLIIDEMPLNPKYYERMSLLLDDLIKQRRREAIDYKNYLEKIVELTRRTHNPIYGDAGGSAANRYPGDMNSPALRALYDNIYCADDTPENRARLAARIDASIRDVKKADFRGNSMKEREVRNAIAEVLNSEDDEYVDRLFEIAKSQHEY